MDLLLDTHTLIWFSEGETSKLSNVAKEELEKVSNRKFISIATFWEIAIKTSIGKLKLNRDLRELRDFIKQYNFDVVEISVEHTLAIQKLPLTHRDPFDRMLVAQSSIEDFSIVTADKNIKQYPIKTIW